MRHLTQGPGYGVDRQPAPFRLHYHVPTLSLAATKAVENNTLNRSARTATSDVVRGGCSVDNLPCFDPLSRVQLRRYTLVSTELTLFSTACGGSLLGFSFDIKMGI